MLDVAADEAAHLLYRGCGGRVGGLGCGEQADPVHDEPVDQVEPRGEDPAEVVRVDAGCGGDGVQADPGSAVAGEELDGGVEDVENERCVRCGEISGRHDRSPGPGAGAGCVGQLLCGGTSCGEGSSGAN